MPPNADAIRRRAVNICESTDDGDSATIRMISKKEIAGNEVAIDGTIYSLDGFVHPGGEQIKVFGGNDVTVTYKMIHPHHRGTKFLEKMKVVGKQTDYVPEYEFDTPFEREIKQEVFKIVRMGNEFGTPGYLFRAAAYCVLLAVCQSVWVLYGPTWALAVALGMSKAAIGLNVQHDANHGAASKNYHINDVLGYGADFIGGSKYTWIAQHWTHHAFTGHSEMDPDSFSAEPMLLFNDYPLDHPSRRWFHKFQGFYFLLILSFYWASSVFNPQILDLKQRGAQSVGINLDNDFLAAQRPISHFLRLLYIFMNCVVPFIHEGGFWTTLSKIMLMGATESLGLATLFALSHNFEEVEIDPTKDFKENNKKICWMKSQVETSSSYGGFISGYLTGGLNFQVEHHLFPRMCSAWYPYIAPTVRAVCKKHGVRYVYYPWIWTNFVSTCKYMRNAGVGARWEMIQDNPISGRT